MAHLCGCLRYCKLCGSSARYRVVETPIEQSPRKVTSLLPFVSLMFLHSEQFIWDLDCPPCTRVCFHTRTHKPKHTNLWLMFSFLISPFPECLSHGTRSVSSVTHAPSPWTPPIVAKDQTRIFTVKVIIHNNKIKSQHPINKYKRYTVE